MITIYKYELPVEDVAIVKMPWGAQILYLEVQKEVPYIWALVNTAEPLTDRKFRVMGTGHPLHLENVPGANLITRENYFGSFMLHNGALVFHVFSMSQM